MKGLGILGLIFFFFLSITALVVISTISEVLNSAAGSQYTKSNWFNAENKYCSFYGYIAQKYISTECTFFGCQDIEKTKCVNNNSEMLIDYNNQVFCKYKLKGDFGFCDGGKP